MTVIEGEFFNMEIILPKGYVGSWINGLWVFQSLLTEELAP